MAKAQSVIGAPVGRVEGLEKVSGQAQYAADILCIVDIPRLKTVMIQSDGGPGPYDAKGIGEHANVSPPAAIANAVDDAIGVRLFELPITAEKIFKARKLVF